MEFLYLSHICESLNQIDIVSQHYNILNIVIRMSIFSSSKRTKFDKFISIENYSNLIKHYLNESFKGNGIDQFCCC